MARYSHAQSEASKEEPQASKIGSRRKLSKIMANHIQIELSRMNANENTASGLSEIITATLSLHLFKKMLPRES